MGDGGYALFNELSEEGVGVRRGLVIVHDRKGVDPVLNNALHIADLA